MKGVGGDAGSCQSPRQLIGKQEICQFCVGVLEECGVGPRHENAVQKTAGWRSWIAAALACWTQCLRILEVKRFHVPMCFRRNHDDPRWRTGFQLVEQEC